MDPWNLMEDWLNHQTDPWELLSNKFYLKDRYKLQLRITDKNYNFLNDN